MLIKKTKFKDLKILSSKITSFEANALMKHNLRQNLLFCIDEC